MSTTSQDLRTARGDSGRALVSRIVAAVVGLGLVGGSITAQAARLQYDSRNRLVRVIEPEQTTTFEYDGMGNLTRTCRLLAAGTAECTRVITDGRQSRSRVIGEVGSSGTTHYAYGPEGLAVAQRDGQARVVLLGRNGTVQAMVEPAGEVVGRVAYDAFGRTRATLGETISIGYAGEWRSESEAVWLRARMYLPWLGRFAQRDTYQGDPAVPESLNRYTYAHDNPLKWTDPSGHAIPLAWWGVALVTAGASLLAQAIFTAPPAVAPTHRRDFVQGPGLGAELSGFAMETAVDFAIDGFPDMTLVKGLPILLGMTAAYGDNVVRSVIDAASHPLEALGRGISIKEVAKPFQEITWHTLADSSGDSMRAFLEALPDLQYLPVVMDKSSGRVAMGVSKSLRTKMTSPADLDILLSNGAVLNALDRGGAHAATARAIGHQFGGRTPGLDLIAGGLIKRPAGRDGLSFYLVSKSGSINVRYGNNAMKHIIHEGVPVQAFTRELAFADLSMLASAVAENLGIAVMHGPGVR